MLTKCANPACSATFRYLHDGRLFLIESADEMAGAEPPGSVGAVRKVRALRHYWLCDKCCRTMTIVFDREHTVRVVPIEGPAFWRSAAS